MADSEEEDVIEEVKRAGGEDEERFLIITQDVKKTFSLGWGGGGKNMFVIQRSLLCSIVVSAFS